MSLRRRYGSAAEARRLATALAADQPAHVTWRARGRVLSFVFTATSPESARATSDDLLACLSVAEKTSGVTPPRRSDLARPSPADP